jgi:cell division septum initiation protein DivIVA
MTDFRQMADKAINLGKQLKAVMEVGEFLDSIGDLEQVRREARAAADTALQAQNKARAAREEAETELNAWTEKLAAARTEAEAKVREAEMQAKSLAVRAQAEAEQLLAEAKAKADRLTTDAQRTVSTAKASVEELRTQEGNLRQAIAQLEAELAKLRKRVGLS